MTDRIHKFLRRRRDEGPCLVVDLEVVRENYLAFAKALPDTRVFYAVKANPAPEILELLGDVVSQTDTALVFISHDLPVVAQLVDDLVVMRQGAVMEQATVAQVLAGAEHSYTRTLLESARAITRLPEGTAR